MYPQVYIAPMARYIAFDWGLRRTGIAVTDSSAIVASPLKTVETKALFKEIDQIILAEPCRGIIVGVPGLIVGLKTDSSDGIEKFISHGNVPILIVNAGDNRFDNMKMLINGKLRKLITINFENIYEDIAFIPSLLLIENVIKSIR